MAARTALTVQDIKGAFAAIAVGGADITFAAADATSKNYFPCTGKEILIAYNSDEANPYTVTITSVDDEKGRSEDIAAYSLAAGDYAVFGVGLTNAKGWKQTSGQIYLEASNEAVKFAVLRLPA
jgi:hypothetical protein